MSRQSLSRCLRIAFLAVALVSGEHCFADESTGPAQVAGYDTQMIDGWTVHVSEKLKEEQPEQVRNAIDLLRDQLRLVKQLLPPEAYAKIDHVPIWFSPTYPGFGPTGEYHPGKRWLIKNGRRPELHRCIEFTNVAIFGREIQRMPVLLLHEIAHAYHDQVLGFDHPEVKALYEIAKSSGDYDAVRRHDGKTVKAYAMSNEREYFAETSEAFFGRNDFFPFDRKELANYDPRMEQLLEKLWSEPIRPVEKR